MDMGVRLEEVGLGRDKLLSIYGSMVRIRKFEEKIISFYAVGRLPSFPHAYIGEEAVGVGICSNLRDDDTITSTHRAEGHLIAKGVATDRLMAELFGKATGVCKGKGGSMHFADKAKGVLGATGIVGSGIPIAVGSGLSAQVRHTDQVSVAFFGDGAVPSGAFHEGLNLAATWNLPVIFVCENNLYSTWTPFSSVSKNTDVASRAAGYGMPGATVDGMDVLAVHRAANEAVARARGGKGPTLMECKTYRFGGHYIGDPDNVRSKEEKDEWMKRDPIKGLRSQITDDGVASADELKSLEQEIQAEIDAAVEFAEKSPFPPNEDALRDIFYEGPVRDDTEPPDGELGDRTISMRDAINEAVREEMQRDPLIIIYGQGYLGRRGGPFSIMKGVQDIFGAERVRDAPISELTLAGAGVGAAMTGLRPVVEIQFIDFTTLASDQIVNQMAKVRYMFGGQFKVPYVIRSVIGAQGSAAAHHSQSLEAWYLHVPGLKVIIPSTPYEAKGLLKSAIRDDNPCLFLEPRALYGLKGPVPEKDYAIPLGKAKVKKTGRDLTIITWARMVHEAISAADKLEGLGISAEVIDIRSLVPLDKLTLLASVRKTGRALIVHEANKTGGAGGEISAILSEEIFGSLKAPIRRIGSPDIIFPYSPPLENYILPNAATIEGVAKELVAATK